MRLRALVRLTHLWAGLALSVLLLVLGVTGSALVYKEAWWRLVHPELRVEAEGLSARDHAAAAEAARARYGAALRSVKLPEPGVGAYHLYLEGGEAFLAVPDHRVIDQWGPSDRAMAVLFDLHAHLLAGERGEKVGGVAALLGAFLVVTGVVLWWPARRRFSLSTLLPTGLTRARLLPSHRDLGLLASPLLLLVLLTGAGIVFYGAAGVLLHGIFGDPAPTTVPVPEAAAPAGRSSSVARAFAAANTAFPDARIVFYYPPVEGSGVHGFRLKQPCELHPNGRSYLYLDAGSAVLQRVDACAEGPGQRALHALYPLHSGKTGSGLYTLAVFLSGWLLAALSATGAAAYLARLRGNGSRPRPPRAPPRVRRQARLS